MFTKEYITELKHRGNGDIANLINTPAWRSVSSLRRVKSKALALQIKKIPLFSITSSLC
jgi:hypothetical protein